MQRSNGVHCLQSSASTAPVDLNLHPPPPFTYHLFPPMQRYSSGTRCNDILYFISIALTFASNGSGTTLTYWVYKHRTSDGQNKGDLYL